MSRETLRTNRLVTNTFLLRPTRWSKGSRRPRSGGSDWMRASKRFWWVDSSVTRFSSLYDGVGWIPRLPSPNSRMPTTKTAYFAPTSRG
ncbi:hypothetical protein BRC79_00325 [Halobacteriales archaeon QH_8_67_27]|nr:MAG: hypothetical protein BRC79_00325 [Halobacteriales archaeon QH_8_67_27]